MKIGQQSARNITSIILHPDKATDKIKAKYRDEVAAVKELMDEKGISVNEAVYLYRNEIQEIPKCKVCGTQLEFKLRNYSYDTFCSHKCRSAFQNCAKDSVIVDGVEFGSIKEAYTHLGISRFKFKQMLFSPKHPSTRYVEDHDTKCLSGIKEIQPSLVDRKFLEDWKATKATLHSLADSLDRSISTISLALIYHDIDPKFDQIRNESTRTILNSEEEFTDMFNSMSSDMMARELGVFDGTIRSYARRYDLDTARYGWQRSRGEIELCDYIQSICPSAKASVRPLKDSRLEADVFIDYMNIGFEYNGCYVHSEAYKDDDYHEVKSLAFANEGIRLIQIWEDDWDMNREVVKRFIKNILIKDDKQIGARKTVARIISKVEFDVFMNNNHMQGSTSAGIMIGLDYEGHVVAAMGFSDVASNIKPVHGGKGAYLVRFANTNITGAFSKLMKFFASTFQTYSHVITFADLEIVDRTNNVYNKNGFVEIGRLSADYKYFKKSLGKRKHKFLFRKAKFAKLGLEIDGKTERELAKEYGLVRCYDSGKIRYLWKP